MPWSFDWEDALIYPPITKDCRTSQMFKLLLFTVSLVQGCTPCTCKDSSQGQQSKFFSKCQHLLPGVNPKGQ